MHLQGPKGVLELQWLTHSAVERAHPWWVKGTEGRVPSSPIASGMPVSGNMTLGAEPIKGGAVWGSFLRHTCVASGHALSVEECSRALLPSQKKVGT